MIAVQNYEILGILPQRKRKTEVKGKGVIIADVENNVSTLFLICNVLLLSFFFYQMFKHFSYNKYNVKLYVLNY